MIALYYFVFATVLLLAGPFLLLRKKARAGLASKLGNVATAVRNAGAQAATGKSIWFHAVSVGEFNATFPLLKAFREQHPDWAVFVSTTTATGQQLASDKVGSWATVFYFPYDLPWATAVYLDAIKPAAVVIAETEIWPGFVNQCHQRGVKICCVNGRISPRSFKRYKALRAFFGPVLRQFSAFAVQSDQEVERYNALGVPTERLTNCGNMKFDGIKPIATEEQAAIRKKLGLVDGDLVLVGGSTHETEESALIEAAQKCKAGVHLVLAPRHPERFERVCQIIRDYGMKARRFTKQERLTSEKDVYVLDTIGQLTAFYSAADIAFVGGTIAPIGGHSLVEPFAYAVPVLCGPHTEKTRDVAQALLERQAMIQVATTQELGEALNDLVASAQKRAELGSAGQRYLNESQGAVERTMHVLDEVLGLNDSARTERITEQVQ